MVIEQKMLYTFYGHRKCIGVFGLSSSAARDSQALGDLGDFITKRCIFRRILAKVMFKTSNTCS